MTLALMIIGLVYLIAMGLLLVGTLQLTEFISEEKTTKNRFSIVIPFRNEAANLPALLESVKKLKYPAAQFELLFVDDASEDISVALIEELLKTETELAVQVLSNIRTSGSPKKDAITTGIRKAKYEWILTTDADCQVPKYWLREYDAFIQKHQPKCIAGPVGYASNRAFIQQYQQMDGWSLQGVAMGSFGLNNPLLCNGANLAYRKDAFEQLNGFGGNDHIASGDDIFILEKMKQAFPKDIQFLKSKEAIVFTQPCRQWTELVQQRIRWASKTSKQKNLATTALGLIVFAANLLVVLGLLLCFIKHELIPYYAAFLGAKLLIDFIFLSRTAAFFTRKVPFVSFLLSVLCYPVITVCVVLGSFTGSYQWKGRTHKKHIN